MDDWKPIFMMKNFTFSIFVTSSTYIIALIIINSHIAHKSSNMKVCSLVNYFLPVEEC